MVEDSRFTLDDRFDDVEDVPHASGSQTDSVNNASDDDSLAEHSNANESDEDDALGKGMNPEGFAGPSGKIVKPLTPEALAAFNAAQARTGVVYISRIPPGMRPPKVRHLMTQYGEVGRVYLQQEGASGIFLLILSSLTYMTDPKRAYLRKKFTATKKAHFTDAQPIGGKKGTRWRDDVWTMKYLPRFKWDMLTEQIGKTSALGFFSSLRPGSTRGSDSYGATAGRACPISHRAARLSQERRACTGAQQACRAKSGHNGESKS
jgi:ESF2/ABP1 family protein